MLRWDKALFSVALVAAAALGAGASAAVFAVTGSEGEASASSTTGELDAESLYDSVAAGVVAIRAEVPTGSEAHLSPFGEPGSARSTATGSGFVVTASGRIVTAAHVVDEASSVEVTLQDGTTRTATLLGKDHAIDIAVLEIDPSGLDLQPLELGSSASVNVGAEVAAVGAPFEYADSISTGIVSGLGRTIEAPNGFTVPDAIQTDAAINPGNSGGPLLDAEGEVIGVVDEIATDGSTDQSSGVGFAVPSDLVASEIDQLSNGEEVEHAYLGVATTTSTGSIQGALVRQVVAGSPAMEVGVEDGDILTALDETPIASSDDLVAGIAEHDSGEKVVLAVQRGSESLKFEVRLAAQPAQPSKTR